jgi:hypothetical protein
VPLKIALLIKLVINFPDNNIYKISDIAHQWTTTHDARRDRSPRSILRIFFMLVSNYIPAARRAAPSGICGRTTLATRAGVCPASQVDVKDLTPSDTLVNCTYLVCTLYWIHFSQSQTYCSNVVLGCQSS